MRTNKLLGALGMNAHFKNLTLSLIAGIMFYYVLMYFWGYFPNINPLFQWLLSCCAGTNWIRPVIWIQDILINIALCIPLAYFLLKLRPKNILLSAIFAIIPIIFLGSYHLMTPEYSGWHISDFAAGWVMQIFSLLVAILLLKYRAILNGT